MKQFLSILLNTLGILGIVVFGAFILVLIVDLLLTALDGNRDGIFIKRGKTEENTGTFTFDNANTQESYPVIEEQNEFDPVDMQKALEEQRIAEEKRNQAEQRRIKQEEDKHNKENLINRIAICWYGTLFD